ncbi:MAG: hypothetical protein OIF58_05085 [Cohaesibacter sp.]|nr:hypothetical protein [Cohaesibacter sp.]
MTISLRLTAEEKSILVRASKGQSLSAYIRKKLFASDSHTDNHKTEMRLCPKERQKLLAKILSELGKAQLSQSLCELADAAKLGTLPLTPDVCSDIQKAITKINSIRSDLLKAMGLRNGGSP